MGDGFANGAHTERITQVLLRHDRTFVLTTRQQPQYSLVLFEEKR
jgi:hypothetical protein